MGLDQLVATAASFLDIDYISTENASQLEQIVVSDRMIAGIEFHHFGVCSICKHIYFIYNNIFM